MRPEQRVLCSPAPPSPASLLCFAAEARCTSIRRSQTAGDAGPKAPHRHYALSIYQVYHGYYMHTMYTYGTHQTQYAAWTQSVLCACWHLWPDAHVPMYSSRVPRVPYAYMCIGMYICIVRVISCRTAAAQSSVG